ncbi:hypothetical protein Plhal304r1_c057g0143811 [Plasmopara halstedii]
MTVILTVTVILPNVIHKHSAMYVQNSHFANIYSGLSLTWSYYPLPCAETCISWFQSIYAS